MIGDHDLLPAQAEALGRLARGKSCLAVMATGRGKSLIFHLHAARVAIDEEGVTAAAYTVMMEAGAAMPPDEEIDFTLDRPFVFAITSQDGLPLFIGIVNTPN